MHVKLIFFARRSLENCAPREKRISLSRLIRFSIEAKTNRDFSLGTPACFPALNILARVGGAQKFTVYFAFPAYTLRGGLRKTQRAVHLIKAFG